MKILIVKFGALGDVVGALPFLNILRRLMPNAEIDWVVEPLSYPILDQHPALDNIILFRRDQGFRQLFYQIKQLRKNHYDLVIDLQRILRSGLVTRLTGARRRLGFDRDRCKEQSWLFTTERIPAKPDTSHIVDQYIEFARHLGATDLAIEYGIHLNNADREAGLTFFSGQHPRIALNIGATKPANLWPAASFARLAHLIHDRFGCRPLLTGNGPEDKQRAQAITKANQNVINCVGRMTLPELMGTLETADAVISADTGPLHLATGLGTPVIALFGAADIRRTGPYLHREYALVGTAPCAPCRKRHCTQATNQCLESISPEMALKQLTRLLDCQKIQT
ncbi:MAG: glycosyltransferase family 9 protein [Desulfobulbaceae bacterium]|uniref:Glycosyltransferase family 9 protein n=1 Tax=Candidatus Desulfatifera sulfidica TaxID=2841691 RepID=A0A8J6NAN6_9BACT|nr:glycosyltransferase family 9 protein [Candidatus Desulfatifera sulfidica]